MSNETAVKWTADERGRVTAQVDHGATDDKGRALGHFVVVAPVPAYDVPFTLRDGSVVFKSKHGYGHLGTQRPAGFDVRVQPTRNGKSFGAIQYAEWVGETLDEAKAFGLAKALRLGVKARKDAAKGRK